jgi:hypothetical protein
MPDEAGLISVSEASARTGYTTRHITRLIRAGRIAGKKIGPIWLTTTEAVESTAAPLWPAPHDAD